MASKATVTRKLHEFGFEYSHWTRARAFYFKRGYTLGYGGRGRFRGTFHVSYIDNGWHSLRMRDPTELLDAPTATMHKTADLAQEHTGNVRVSLTN